jgi:membrane protein
MPVLPFRWHDCTVPSAAVPDFSRLSDIARRIVRRFLDVRVMGLAAEMTYYAVLSLFPLIGALGASLGFLERFAGSDAAHAAEAAIVSSLGAIFSAEITGEVIAPLVQGLLYQERTAFALGGFLLSLFLASRVFRSAIDTLDSAYGVEERRGILALWGLGFLFAIGAVLAGTIMLSMVVVGPLLGGGRVIADFLGLGTVFEFAWYVLRWPVVFTIATAFLATLYHFGPNARNRWRDCLPGAAFGVAGTILIALALRYYFETIGTGGPEIADADAAVATALQVVGAFMAVLFWLWLTCTVVLTGGVVNAELERFRHGPPVPKA